MIKQGKFIIGRLGAFALGLMFSRPGESTLVRLGSEYGGWICATKSLTPGGYAVCAGAGEDVSFDIELVKRFATNVICVDPTPRSIAHVRSLLEFAMSGSGRNPGQYALDGFDARKFEFLPVALWSQDGMLRLYEPADPAHVSHSAVNLQRTEKFIEVKSSRVATILGERGKARELQLLKLDIEGAECEVLEDILASDIRPMQILVELDALYSFNPHVLWKVVRCVLGLRKAGYRLVSREGANFTFELGS